MEILGIGPTELVFIILIAIIVLGPKEMEKAGRTIGRWLNQIRTSEGWKIMRDTSRELSNLPNKWMREANLEMWESQEGARTTRKPRTGESVSSPRPRLSLSDEPGNTIQPPHEESKPADDPDKHG